MKGALRSARRMSPLDGRFVRRIFALGEHRLGRHEHEWFRIAIDGDIVRLVSTISGSPWIIVDTCVGACSFWVGALPASGFANRSEVIDVAEQFLRRRD